MPRNPANRLTGTTLALVCVAFACIAGGWVIAGQTAHAHTHSGALKVLPVAALAFAAIVMIVAELGTTALLVWIPLSVLFYPLSKFMPGAPIVTFDRIWVVAMLVLLVTLPPTAKAAKPTRRMIVALAMMAAVYGARAISTPEQTLYVIRLWIDILVLPLVLFLVVRRAVMRDQGLIERIAFALMVAGAVLGLIGIAEHILGFQLATLTGSQVRFDTKIDAVRVSGPYPGPETYGLTLLMCLAATLYWMQLRGKSRHLFAGLALALELGGIAFTLFRVAWIGAVVVIFVAFAFRPRQLGRALGVTAALGLVLALAMTQLSSVPIFQARVGNTENLSSRLGSYQQAIQIWRSHPFLGVGVEQYNPHATALPIIYTNGAISEPDPHDAYLAVLAEVGVFGFAALAYLTLTTARLIRALNRRRRSQSDILLAACVLGGAIAYLLFSLSLSIFRYEPSNEFFAILLGMAAARVDVLRSQ